MTGLNPFVQTYCRKSYRPGSPKGHLPSTPMLG